MTRPATAALPASVERAPSSALVQRVLPSWLLIAAAATNVAIALPFAFYGTEHAYWLGEVVVLDGVSRLFVLLNSLVFLGVAMHVYQRLHDESVVDVGGMKLVALVLLFIVASDASLLCNDLTMGWVCLELSTFAAAPMIAGSPSAIRASWKYFVFSGVGLALAFMGFVCLQRGIELSVHHEASLQVNEIVDEVAQTQAFWRRLGIALLVLGYGTKLGLAPMFAWLPDTYSESPAEVTALLAGVQFNAAMVSLFRVLDAYRATERGFVSSELIVLGVVSMTVAAFHIVAAKDVKRLISYGAINHAGVIAIGLGLGRTATFGVVLYVISNTLAKAILFLTAGSIERRFRTSRLDALRGLIVAMPYSALVFLLGTFSLLGFAPFGSFLGEVEILQALVSSGHHVVFGVFVAVLTVVFVATGRALFPMIWGEPSRQVAGPRERVVSFWPHWLLIACLVMLGVYTPAPVVRLMHEVSDTIAPAAVGEPR